MRSRAPLLILVAAAAGTAYWFFARDGFRQALESQASSWLGHPVRIGSARAQFLPRLAVALRNVRVGDPEQLVLDQVDLASDLRPLFSGRIENAEVKVSGSRIDLPLPFGLPQEADVTTTGDTSDETDAAADAPVRIVSIKSIALRSVRLRSRGRDVVVFGWGEHVTGFALGMLTWAATVAVVTDGRDFEGDAGDEHALRSAGVAIVEDVAAELVGRREPTGLTECRGASPSAERGAGAATLESSTPSL